MKPSAAMILAVMNAILAIAQRSLKNSGLHRGLNPQVLHNNRVKFPKDILLHCSVNQYGRGDVTCNSSTRGLTMFMVIYKIESRKKKTVSLQKFFLCNSIPLQAKKEKESSRWLQMPKFSFVDEEGKQKLLKNLSCHGDQSNSHSKRHWLYLK